jgi:hypothetical protein
MPEIMPEKRGAPLAKAIAKHSGRATKKRISPDNRSDLKYLNTDFKIYIKPSDKWLYTR